MSQLTDAEQPREETDDDEVASIMPTAKCHNCGRRIRIDFIDEHSETCEDQIPDEWNPGSQEGTTISLGAAYISLDPPLSPQTMRKK